MKGPVLYLTFPGNAREALEFYASVFGGELQLHTYAAFSRMDGPAEAIAHGVLSSGPVSLFGSRWLIGYEPTSLVSARLGAICR